MVTSTASSRGPVDPEKIPPAVGTVADGVEILGGFGNALTVDLGDGYLQIDTGATAAQAMAIIGQLDPTKPVRSIVFSHGHLGYNLACQTWLDDAATKGLAPPTVVAHEHAASMIRLFQQTQPLMDLLLAIQFTSPIVSPPPPIPLMLPNLTFSDTVTIGGTGRDVQLFVASSETRGSIGAWIPDVEVLYAGSAGLPVLPNLGMPLWPTGDDEAWANTLDRMAGYNAQHLVRQYGPVIHGEDEVRAYLETTARALRYLRSEVIEHLNAGLNLNETINAMTYPAEIFGRDYLSSGYSTHRDAVRQVWSSITGWWTRNPTELAAVPEAEVAQAIRSAITDPDAVLVTARSLQAAGRQALALHVVDLLALVPGDEAPVVAARALKVELCRELAAQSRHFDEIGLYTSAAAVIEAPPARPTGIR